MPRPRKWRKVCCLPESNVYGPLNNTEPMNKVIVMAVEEYEAIRLIDLENLTQEECAEKMNVSRATVQSIYKDARSKIADSLVNGNHLKIEGGDYQLYNDKERIHGCRRCQRNKCENKPMKNKCNNEN